MSAPTDKSGPGDSTPDFGWLGEESGDTGTWRPPSSSDSATKLLDPGQEIEAGRPDPFDLTAVAPGGVPAPPDLEETVSEAPPAVGGPGRTVVESLVIAPATPAASSPPAPAPHSTAGGESPHSSPSREAGRFPLLLVALISYASAATVGLVYLYSLYRSPNPHSLESLPDVPPLEEHEVFRWTPVESPMPPGHTLRLGEARRFGNIVVEPLRVDRGPLTFSHYSGTGEHQRAGSAPVLKLWVRFTNVSQDQRIAPLDARLLFARKGHGETTQANHLVFRRDVKDRNGPVVFAYDEPTTSEWDLAGQQLGRVLAPGESVETYLPTTEEGLEGLTGELLWRMHFRKGYSPQGYGVTTLVEVAFDSDAIVAEGPS